MAAGDRFQLVLRMLLEAPNHESYPQEICDATGLDDDEVSALLALFEDTDLVRSRDGHHDRYHRLTERGQHLATYMTRSDDLEPDGLAIRAERT